MSAASGPHTAGAAQLVPHTTQQPPVATGRRRRRRSSSSSSSHKPGPAAAAQGGAQGRASARLPGGLVQEEHLMSGVGPGQWEGGGHGCLPAGARHPAPRRPAATRAWSARAQRCRAQPAAQPAARPNRPPGPRAWCIAPSHGHLRRALLSPAHLDPRGCPCPACTAVLTCGCLTSSMPTDTRRRWPPLMPFMFCSSSPMRVCCSQGWGGEVGAVGAAHAGSRAEQRCRRADPVPGRLLLCPAAAPAGLHSRAALPPPPPPPTWQPSSSMSASTPSTRARFSVAGIARGSLSSAAVVMASRTVAAAMRTSRCCT